MTTNPSKNIAPAQIEQLRKAAGEVRQRAYAPYSNFLVGAALLTDSGLIFQGCNVENASYGLAICAERSAISSAVAAGCQRFRAVAIVSRGGVTPCGACRQVLTEFGLDIEILLFDADSNELKSRFLSGELLPGAFKLDDAR